MVIRRVGPLSVAKVMGALYALFGLIAGTILSLLSIAGGAFGDAGSSGPMGMLFGAAAIMALPFVYGILGFISALIGALLYNGIAGWLGGIEIDVQ